MSCHKYCKTVLLIAVSVCFLGGRLYADELDQVLMHVDAETSALIRVEPAVFMALVGDNKKADADLEEADPESRLQRTRKILGDDPVWLTVGFPQMPTSIQIVISDPDDTRINALKELWDILPPAPYGGEPPLAFRSLANPKTKYPADAERQEQWKKLMRQTEDAEGDGMIRFGCLPPEYLYETYRELEIELPERFGGGPISLLTEGLQSVSGTIDVATGALVGTIDSASPEAATALAKWATKLKFSLVLKAIADSPPSNQTLHLIGQLGRSDFSPSNSQVQWRIPPNKRWQQGGLLKLFSRTTSNRSTLKRLRNIALGIHNYESAYRHFPLHPNASDTKGATGLSWRVQILPFIEEADLYNKFALDEPWDSPTNIKLLPEMPAVYSDFSSHLQGRAQPGATTIVAPISEDTILGASKKVAFGDILDGSSNTILLVTVKDELAVPWTAPQDYVFDRAKPAAGLKFSDGRVPVVLSDGSTAKLVENNDWVSLFEMNDGNVVQAKE